MINELPKYKYDDNGKRFWLTICTTVAGKWNIGYCDTEGAWLEVLAEDLDELPYEKTPEGVSSPDTILMLTIITDKYEIRHPKPSISRATARKMLNRDLANLLNQVPPDNKKDKV